MGLDGISIWQLLILLAIVVMVFGTKRLRNLGGDLGHAFKSFKSAMKDDQDDDGNHGQQPQQEEPRVFDQVSETRQSTAAGEQPDQHEQHADRH